jgi:hypothetical protein
VGAAAMVPALLLSDERVKRDIVPMGEQNGHKLYRFKYYVWSDPNTLA